MTLPKPVRATLRALWREFRRCAYRYPALYHEMMVHQGDSPDPSVDFAKYDLLEICKSFRQAFADKFGKQWDEWYGVKAENGFFTLGRFYGDGEGVEEFKRLAESAFTVAIQIAINEWSVSVCHALSDRADAPPRSYQGWLDVLYGLTSELSTPFLRSDLNCWWNHEGSSPPDDAFGVGTPKDGGAPYPLHPTHFRLLNSVFTSSLAAIELIMDEERAFMVSDPTPDELAKVFGRERELFWRRDGEEFGKAESDVAKQEVEAARSDEDMKPPILKFAFDGKFWELQFDTGSGTEEYTKFADSAGFHLYRKILSQPEKRLSVDDLGVVYEVNLGRQETADSRAIQSLDKSIEQVKYQIERSVNPERLDELQDELKGLQRQRGSLATNRDEPRAWRSGYGKAVNKTGVNLLRARQKIALYMPRFAEYLRRKVRSDLGSYVYWP